jgi:UDP-glucuronate 4-epimerase
MNVNLPRFGSKSTKSACGLGHTLFLFTKAMLAAKPIQMFNNGQMTRDFTYVDDIVESLIRVLDKPAAPDPGFDPGQPDAATSWAPHRVFNIGNSNPTALMDYIEALEGALGISATKQFLPMQLGDVPATAADTSALEAWTGFKPNTPIHERRHPVCGLVPGVLRYVDPTRP